MVKFAHEHNLVICADEVYQKNIYCDKPFISMKKIMHDLGAPYNQTELISFHSTSKGLTGECGLRGGYMELENIDPYVKSQILKMRTITLCPNTVGQLACELMVNPPKEGVNTADVVSLFNAEVENIFGGLKSRAKLLQTKLNSIPGIKANEFEGAMYSFPKIEINQSAVEAAKKKGLAPDTMFCLECLENTGILLVAGSGFGQRAGTYHFRITNLIYNIKEFDEALELLRNFAKKFNQKYP